jgi:predicted amidohydrolase
MVSIGVAQIKNSTELAENYQTIKACLEMFKSSNADLILFPECSLSGFSSKIGECTTESISMYLDELQNWSSKHNKMIVLPTALRENKIFNTGFIFQSGSIDQFYKVGLTESEQGFFSVPDNYKKRPYTVNNYSFIPLICLEAQEKSDLYFKKNDVDFVLWPGYWGWDAESKWSSHANDGKENLVFTNVSSWKVPLIQSNFAFNDIGDDRSNGPHGQSVVVDKNNELVYQASYEKQECFIVELNDGDISNCYKLGFIE